MYFSATSRMKPISAQLVRKVLRRSWSVQGLRMCPCFAMALSKRDFGLAHPLNVVAGLSLYGSLRHEPHRLVFVDETGATTKMTRLRGRCLRGHRLRANAPFGHWTTQTFIAGLRQRGLTTPFVVDQPMNRRIFDVWVETQLAPTRSKGDVVILDNLPAHKS